MPAPANREEYLELVRKSGVLDTDRLEAYARALPTGAATDQPPALAQKMVQDGLLTTFQAKQFLMGKWRRFMISGKYKLLELLGAGGMGAVYLCEHIFMRRLVALKVLPVDKIQDPSTIERFYREARAAGSLVHPNIVHTYDIDQDDKIHFLVMEYVDGASLQEIVSRHGPLDPVRAAHYIRQAALGLQHAYEKGLVHRDVKPGNLLLDRAGTIKVLDLGLARFFNAHQENITERYDDKCVLGTADYLAPEQAMQSNVDIRADIYSLGATFYFLLTGRSPFEGATLTQKLLWHQTKQPTPIRQLRAEVSEELAAVIEKMMAKAPADRYQTPQEVAEALAPWTATPISPPSVEEMPRRSAASLTAGAQGTSLSVPPLSRVTASAVLDRPASGPAPPRSAVNGRSTNPSSGPRTPVVAPATASASTDDTRPGPKSAPPRPGPRSRVAKPPRKRRKSWLDDKSPFVVAAIAAGGSFTAAALVGLLWWLIFGGHKSPERPGLPVPPPPAAKSSGPRAPAPTVPAVAKVITAEEVPQHLNEYCTVSMKVLHTGKATTSARWFLNSAADYRDTRNFTVTFVQSVLDQIKARHGTTDLDEVFKGKTVQVTGTITTFSNRPQIEVTDLDQIKIVPAK